MIPGTFSFPLDDTFDLEFVVISGVEFLMGSLSAKENRTETPQHPLRIPRPLYISRFLVTQAQWTAMMGKNSSMHRGDPNLPVDQVGLFDCQEFCERLCQRHERAFRLPSEAEWEYACRAGTATNFAFMDMLSSAQANFNPYALRFGPSHADQEAVVREVELAGGSRWRQARPTLVGRFPPS